MAVNGFPRARRSGGAGRWRRARGSQGCHEPTDRRTSTPPAAAQRPELTPATQLGAWRRPPPSPPCARAAAWWWVALPAFTKTDTVPPTLGVPWPKRQVEEACGVRDVTCRTGAART